MPQNTAHQPFRKFLSFWSFPRPNTQPRPAVVYPTCLDDLFALRIPPFQTLSSSPRCFQPLFDFIDLIPSVSSPRLNNTRSMVRLNSSEQNIQTISKAVTQKAQNKIARLREGMT